jgi:predicted amidohydrolase
MTAFSEARAAGVHRLLVSHPNFIVGMSIPQAAELTQAGVYIEHAASMYDDRSEYASFDLEVLEAWIEGVGVERTILASDLGQVNNPLPAESLALICERLVSNGMSEDAVRSMVAGNPARLLGLD